ncbi:MAG: DUF1016 N-terminal domain-containing protein [Verrucomicrobiota bacterium]
MKKPKPKAKPPAKRPPTAPAKAKSPASARPGSVTGLLTEVRQLIEGARRSVATVVDTLQVMTNFEIGRRIVEHEQKGAKRAAYGSELLKEFSARLTEEFGRGFSEDNLSNMRRFFLTWKERVQIFQSATGKLAAPGIFQSLTEKSAAEEISEKPSRKLVPVKISESAIRKSGNPFTLSWSHYRCAIAKDPNERKFVTF